MADFDIYDIQKKIGYEFKNPTLLKQAFTSPSITQATQHKIENYQVLEFIGDSVLSLAVVKNLAHEFCHIDNDGQMHCVTNEGKLTVRRQELIKNETLAHCSNVLGLDKYLNKAFGFYSVDHKNKKGDLIEAILGAVAFDSNWNMEILSSVIKNILKFKDFAVNYVEKLESFCKKLKIGEVLYAFYQNENGFECCVSVPNAEKVFRETAKSELDAKNKACKAAYNYIKKYRNPKPQSNFNDAVSTLNYMFLVNQIKKPIYKFKSFLEDDEILWKCSATLENIEYKFCASDFTKRKAKQAAAQALLNYINSNMQNPNPNITPNITEDIIENVIEENLPARGSGLLKLIMTKYFEEN